MPPDGPTKGRAVSVSVDRGAARSLRGSASRAFGPIMALTTKHCEPIAPVAHDFVMLNFVRGGSAVLLSEFGEQPVKPGDAILLAANVLCGAEPENHLTVTTIYADTDYLIDQVFWQHVGLLHDRLHAQDFAATAYTEAAQIVRLGEGRARVLMPWLDELVALSIEDRQEVNFYRMQALWFSIVHVIAPFISTSEVRTSSTERATTWPTTPRPRQYAPLRAEARRVAELLRRNPERRWSVTDLANEVHLSKSQLGRLFVEAYGKSPIAYLTMLRTERMAGLLRSTDTPIAVIAREVGWSDPDFAARQFRRSVGVTPSRYAAIASAHVATGSG